MTVIKKSNEKLLIELENNDNVVIDKIHVWLNQNMNEEIASGVIKEKRTIQGCMQYVTKRAKEDFKKTSSGNGAHMVDDSTVYEWVKDFYTLGNIEVEEIKVEVKKPTIVEKVKNVIKKPKQATKTTEGFEQLGLFDE